MEDKQLEEALAESIEQSFNDSELEDIMSEIESLEKEFAEDPNDLSLNEAKANSLQEEIDKEVAQMDAAPESEEVVAQAEEPVAEEPVAEEEPSFDDSDFEEEQTDMLVEDEVVAEVEEPKVVSFEKPAPAPSPAPAPAASFSGNPGQVDFNANGSMDLNINLTVAGQSAQLKVENGGLYLYMNGVQLTIDEENGCAVSMDGGVQFSIPLDPSKVGKKAA